MQNIIKNHFVLLAAAVVIFAGCGNGNARSKTDSRLADDGASVVYFTRDISPEGLVKVYEALGREAAGRVAVKISTGEMGGNNYLKPGLIGDLVKKVNGTIVECNTAYAGARMSTEDHMKVAEAHGFTAIAPVDIMDAEGEIKIPVKDDKWIGYDLVGSHMENYDFMINLAHFKKHS